ncbi:MAG: hypothetical protein [Bacteriophage sp.]|nr:MAG: hypothetical protein [Bacteriophage sp.]
MKDENDKVTVDAWAEAQQYGGVGEARIDPMKDAEAVTGRRHAGSKTADRKRSKWQTPEWLVQFLELRQKARFDLDAAASEDNHKAPAYFTEQNCGLTADWSPYRFVFLNPPYDDITPWVEKAIEETKRNKHMVVHLVLPNDNSTYWYRLAAINSTDIINIIHDGKNSGRLAFIDPDTGKGVNNNNKGTQIFTMSGKGKASVTRYLSRVNMMEKVESDYAKVFGDGSN